MMPTTDGPGRSCETSSLVAELLELADARGGRVVAGIVGPPGVGKSTLAEALVSAIGPSAALVPLDGFHLAAEVARAEGSLGRRGAPDTFDVHGYVALLRRLHDQAATRTPEVVYAPAYRREIEDPIAAAIAVPVSARVIVTEGNYLLLDQPGWRLVAPMLDVAWYLDEEDEARLARLTARHVRFGKSTRAARAWARGSDERNAELIEHSRSSATAVLRWTP